MAGKPLTVDEIRNRVIEVRKVRFGDVASHPRNPKKHPDNQRDAFRGAVREIGFASVPVAYMSERTGKLTWADGHLRGSEAASYVGDVAVLDITDAEADLLLITADPIAHLAQTDAAALEALLRDVQTSDIALQQMLADMATEAGITKKAAGTDTEPQIDKAEELRVKWGVEAGMMFALGEHRLICGDCTDKATVERVMGGEKAEMVFTDPPYNIDYGQIKHPKFRQRHIENDSLGDTEWAAFCDLIVDCIESVTDGCIYVCHAPGPDGRVLASILDKRLHCSTTIIWNKDVFTLGRGKYQNKYEPIWFGWTKTGAGFTGERNLANVWDIPRPKASEEHPTMKPIELVSQALEHASKMGDVIFEPFSGSGTTLIACENLSRRCRAIEISPAYCAVSLERWSAHTSRQPERME